MATFSNTIALPENRTDLEALIEAAIARLDDMDGDCDFEPMLGSVNADMRGGTYWEPEWADHSPNSAALDECEAVSEDEGAACEDEGGDCDYGGDGPKVYLGECSVIRFPAVRT